jgi:hypothetical protein
VERALREAHTLLSFEIAAPPHAVAGVEAMPTGGALNE